MRAGACAVQQTLTPEAASVLKHSLSLARRRGHAQVTPLHVAAILLSSKLSLLRRACLKSQPHQAAHPLQCRALELCFNVALNRLPTTPGTLLHGQPSLSNALVAALKRAQAHQRRGCMEEQQQPLLAIKVELEQLLLSILDDPSVSRVMREAGFSSTAVKNNLEDTSISSVFQCYSSSGGIYSTPSSPPESNNISHNSPRSFWQSQFLNAFPSEQYNPLLFSPQKKVFPSDSASTEEDIKLVIEVLRKNRKNTVIVGDSLSITEGLVSELMGNVKKGDVPEELKYVHFIKFQLTAAPLRLMKKEEVELNISDLKRKVESFVSLERVGGGGVIVYTGDLGWAVDSFSSEVQGHYSPVDHLVAEIGKMVSFYSNANKRVRLIATANYQTYMKCQMKQPPLDIQWNLQAVSVPSAGLGLSLNAATSAQVAIKEERDVLNCCAECTTNYDKEAASLKPNQLPYWLKPPDTYKSEKQEDLSELRKRWNRLCHTLHKGRLKHSNSQCSVGKNQHSYIQSSYPWWSNHQSTCLEDSKSLSFADSILKPIQSANNVPKFRRQQSCHMEFSFTNGGSQHQAPEPNLDALRNRDDKEVKITLALGNSDFSNMAQQEKKKAARNASICKVLQDEIPWQSEQIPSIVETLVDFNLSRKNIWLLLDGNDIIGKRKLARGVAASMSSSKESFFLISMRSRETTMRNCVDLLENALKQHDKLVVLVEDVDHANVEFLRYLGDIFEMGNLGMLQNSCEAIFILTKTNQTTTYSINRENMTSVLQMTLAVSDDGTNNIDHKRKADWELPIKSKSPRKDGIQFPFLVSKGHKEFIRRPSSNTLDLNITAGEEEHVESRHGEIIRTISMDSNQECQLNPIGFLRQIANRFSLNRNAAQDKQMNESFLAKIMHSFDEAVLGNKDRVHFSVEHKVLEEILLCSGSFLGSLFGKWLKDIFQTSLQKIEVCSSREIVSIRLGLAAGKGTENCVKDGFMGSCLPKGIQVSFVD